MKKEIYWAVVRKTRELATFGPSGPPLIFMDEESAEGHCSRGEVPVKVELRRVEG